MANNIELKLELDIKEATKKVNDLEKELKEVSNELKRGGNNNKLETEIKKANTEAKNLFTTLSKIGLALGVGAGISSSLQKIADYQHNIIRLGVVSQATSEQLEQLRQKSLELGGNTEYSSSQVAQAMNYLAMAGFKTNDILSSVNDGCIRLFSRMRIETNKQTDEQTNANKSI